jgi:tyrosyl-tRNA synthetase
METSIKATFEKFAGLGLVHNQTPEAFSSLAENKVFFIGFDPTADSLHLGSLFPLLVVKNLVEVKTCKVICLLGGATAQIGDPSGKSKERNLLSVEEINQNLEKIKKQIESIIGTSENLFFVDNSIFLKELNVLDFLRETGKHFRINEMIKLDSVSKRLESESGLSFTEFSYPLLQGNDFFELCKRHNCEFQLGGSDQWTNILAGINLVKKKLDRSVHGITFPLIVKSNGEKFGKTEDGNIWLSKEKTDSFTFFQFFLKLSDQDVQTLFPKLGFLFFETSSQVLNFMKTKTLQPEKRELQHFLAEKLTELVHGPEELRLAKEKTERMFQNKIIEDTNVETKNIIVSSSLNLVDILFLSGLFSSKNEIRRLVAQNGISLDGTKLFSLDDKTVLRFNRPVVLAKGKKEKLLVNFLSEDQ